ncbi:MAG: hypoxanthine-guanine phosphoribosyltransferase [Gammaproteobacteria bacterium]|nr:MAG: hypoxanthine-guanine phosphoribosyltransferase [Gammaproteobacteria bacterium]
MAESVTAEQAWRVYLDSDLLFDSDQVQAALDRMATEIRQHFELLDPLLLCVMNGGLFTMSELARRLPFPLQMDYLQATRYRGRTTGSEVAWLARPQHSLAGRHVLVVDDILDEGHTLAAILQYCREAGAASVRTAVLVRKRHQRLVEGVEADYIGLEVPDRYVFGCGMDYHDYLRNIPAIHAVHGM